MNAAKCVAGLIPDFILHSSLAVFVSQIHVAPRTSIFRFGITTCQQQETKQRILSYPWEVETNPQCLGNQKCFYLFIFSALKVSCKWQFKLSSFFKVRNPSPSILKSHVRTLSGSRSAAEWTSAPGQNAKTVKMWSRMFAKTQEARI